MRFRALGSELIPVSWQSARRWLHHEPGGRLELLSIRSTVTFPASIQPQTQQCKQYNQWYMTMDKEVIPITYKKYGIRTMSVQCSTKMLSVKLIFIDWMSGHLCRSKDTIWTSRRFGNASSVQIYMAPVQYRPSQSISDSHQIIVLTQLKPDHPQMHVLLTWPTFCSCELDINLIRWPWYTNLT